MTSSTMSWRKGKGERAKGMVPLAAGCLLSSLMLAPFALFAQFDTMIFEPKVPQAQCRQELDAFLDIVDPTQPERTIALVQQFVERFPDSGLLSQVYRRKMKAYKELNDYQGTVVAGEKALELNPHDVDVLLTLAVVIPHGYRDSQPSSSRLDKAKSYAQRALEEIQTLKAAKTVALDQWLMVTAQMKAIAHEALGIVAFKRSRYRESVTELEECTRLNPVADGTQYYRLGIAYLFSGDSFRAKAALQRAVELGPDVVRKSAQEQLELMAVNPQLLRSSGRER
jgi:tetratricopeptide (TPR) repeat protein